MPTASRKKFDENNHFLIEKDVIAGKVVRYILSCKRCKKQKVFPGDPPIIKFFCCKSAIDFQPATGKLPPMDQVEDAAPATAPDEG